jgi:hypothetical protein
MDPLPHPQQYTWSFGKRRRKIAWLTPLLVFGLVLHADVSNTAAAATPPSPPQPWGRQRQSPSPLAFLVGEKSFGFRPSKRKTLATTTAQRKSNHASSGLFLVSSSPSAFPTATSYPIRTLPTSQTMRTRMIQYSNKRRRKLNLHLSVPDDYDPDMEYDPLLVVTKPASGDNDDVKGKIEETGEEDSKKGLNGLTPETAGPTISNFELFSKVEQQQKQIDQLLSILTERSGEASTLSSVSSSSSSSSSSSLGVVSPLSMHSPSLPQQPPPLLQVERSPARSDAYDTVHSSVGVVPVKAMLFIDGTWLYYSIHEREPHLCPIIQKFGQGWQNRYRIDWSALPRILCESLQDPGWGTASTTIPITAATLAASEQQLHDAATLRLSPNTRGTTAGRRPMEIVRVQVFTSYKSDTLPSSWRYRMYEDMKAANYDVFQKETVGRSEKCVDIQLAVDMLHYATVPNAYDVALILTGDKDFTPAMMRTRQKGRKVALVSMKRGCNKALFETPGIKDYDVVWLEEHLDKWIVPIDGADLFMHGGEHSSLSQVSLFTLAKVIYDFIDKSGLDRVASRDIGRYLKYLRLGNDEPLLEHVKSMYRGLRQLLHGSGMFFTVDVDSFQQIDKDDKSYWVCCKPSVKEKLLQEARKTTLSKDEKAFFRQYSTALLKDRRTAYHHTIQLIPGADSMQVNDQSHVDNESKASIENGNGNFVLPEELSIDYSKCTVTQLKARCRDRGLPVVGLKAELLERVLNDVQNEIAKLKEERCATAITSTETTVSGGAQSQSWLTGFTPPEESVATHLKGLVIEYIKARGGSASSRDVGRYLAANQSSKGSNSSALQELKTAYGGLAYFLNLNSNTFGRTDCDADDKNSKYAFQITLLRN